MPNIQDLLEKPADAKPLVMELLHRVDDPEVGVNIVDLGLVRNVQIEDDGDVRVEMTLTTPACPLGPYMQDSIVDVLGDASWVRDVDVKIVWEPPWNPHQDMTAVAKRHLGWLR
jgi:metal-sulfur cluster biosynthetic enzyme